MIAHEIHMTSLRSASLKAFIWFLAITALIAMGSILSGSWSWFEIRILITTGMIAAGSICCMICASYALKTGSTDSALIGCGLAVLSSALVILGAWAEINSEGYWKGTAIACVFAAGAAHCFLLARPSLDEKYTWLKKGSVVTILALCSIITSAILFEIDDHGMFKAIGVVSVLAALESLVIPILAVIKRNENIKLEHEHKIELFQIGPELFQDSRGRRFRLVRVGDHSHE